MVRKDRLGSRVWLDGKEEEGDEMIQGGKAQDKKGRARKDRALRDKGLCVLFICLSVS